MKRKNVFSLSLVCLLLLACSSDKKPATMAPVTSENAAPAASSEAPLSAAAPNIYEFTSGPQGNLSIHIYSEDGIWIIEQNKIDIDGLPTPQGRWTFTTKEKAYAYAQQQLGISESQRNDASIDQEPLESNFFSENLNSGDGLWKATNIWNWQWEIEFAKWTRSNLHPAFFQDLGIENDCADAYYQARMIFAYENALPVSFRLAGGGAYFTQKTVRPEWKKLKTDKDWRKNKQFLKALDYIANTTYTHTLGRDTYPVEISKEGLIEGTAYLSLGEVSGHTLIVNEINVNDSATTRLPMYTLNSTVPKTVRPLYESMFYTSFQPQKSAYGTVGFVRFRWPKSSGASALVDMKDMPYYSEEQFDPDFMEPVNEDNPDYKDFSITVFKRLNPNFDPTLRITEGLTEVRQMVDARKDVILEGYAVCQKGCPEGSADYENWSTPSRDKRIKELITDLERYQNALYAIPSVMDAWQKALPQAILDLDNVTYDFSHLKWTFQNNFFNSDPNQTPDTRWGMSPSAFAQSSYTQLLPMLEERKNKISKTTKCLTSPTCTLYSEEYVSNSTFSEDQKIQNAISIRNQYCDTVGEEKCASFNQALATYTTPVPNHSSFMETWNTIYILNADPRVPEAQRWGKMPDFLDSVIVDGSLTSHGRFKDKVLASSYKQQNSNTVIREIFVIDAATKRISSLGEFRDTTAVEINESAGKALIGDINLKVLNVLDLETMNSSSIDISSLQIADSSHQLFYISLEWTNDSQFILSYMGKLAVFRAKNDGHFVLTQVLEGFSPIDKTNFAYKNINRAASDTAPSDFEITYIDLVNDTRAPVTFRLNDILGKVHPSYLSMESIATPDAALFTWSKYSEAEGTTEGRLIVNLETGKVSAAPNGIQSYLTAIDTNIASSFEYNSKTETSWTVIYFFNDDLSIKKIERIEGNCVNCYDSNGQFLSIGPAIYAVDKTNLSLKKLAQITGLTSKSNASISATQGRFMTVSFSSENLYYNVLFDISNEQPLMAAESLSLNMATGCYPTLSSASYYEIPGADGEVEYYSMNLVMDLDHLDKGPIATPMYATGIGEGGEGHYEGEEDASEATYKFPEAKDIPFGLKVLDQSLIQPITSPVSLVQLGDKKTVIIFK